jgi:hypothetical protein
MKELQNPTGPLARFAGEENQAQCKQLLSDLVSLINSSNLTCVGGLIRLPDLQEFNSHNHLRLSAVSLSMYATMVETYRLFSHDIVELIVDRMDKAEQYIAKSIEYSDSRRNHMHISQHCSWLPLKGCDTFRNVKPIQAADFVAWEARKEHERKNEWWKNHKRGLSFEESLEHQKSWLSEQRKIWPDHRKSFSGLVTTKIHAGVIDYDALCGLHEARRGAWSYEDRDRLWKEQFS